jgi:hypothetical protein
MRFICQYEASVRDMVTSQFMFIPPTVRVRVAILSPVFNGILRPLLGKHMQLDLKIGCCAIDVCRGDSHSPDVSLSSHLALRYRALETPL